jgi:hypothetical protein
VNTVNFGGAIWLVVVVVAVLIVIGIVAFRRRS